MSEQNHSTPPNGGNASLWAAFWMMLLAVCVIAGAGVYLDYRLENFEKRLQHEMQTTQAEVSESRKQSADFAQNLTSTLKELSGLLTITVDSVTQHTATLAAAIEKKEQTQTEALQTALQELSAEIRAQNERLSATLASLDEGVSTLREQSDATHTQLAALGETVEAVGKGVSGGFSSLSGLAQALNETVNTRFKEQAESFNARLAALEENACSSLEQFNTQLTAVAERAKTAEANDQLALRRLAALQDQIGSIEDAQTGWQQRVALAKEQSDATMTGIHESLRFVADRLEVGFAGASQQNEVLRADVIELGATLTHRTEDLLVRMIGANENQEKQAEEQTKQIGSALRSLSEQTGAEMQTLVEQLGQLAQHMDLLEQNLAEHVKQAVAAADDPVQDSKETAYLGVGAEQE